MNVFTITSFCSLILNTLSFVLGTIPLNKHKCCEYLLYPTSNSVSGGENTFQQHYPNFLTSYFSNLVDNMGDNKIGTCGYIALEMLLSYYDTYLNDDIIPEIYDAPSEGDDFNLVDRHVSPGTISDREVKDNYKDLSDEDYINYMINNYASKYLHSKLLSIGIGLGKSSSLPILDMVSVAQYYLTDFLDFNSSDFNIVTYSDAFLLGIRNFIINRISLGYPVLVEAYKNDFVTGHVAVAHDYDPLTGDIFVNYGHRYEGSTRKTLESDGYIFYLRAMVIEWNFDNSNRGYNYKVGNQSYRYDNLLLEHRHHSNSSLTYSYIVDDINHHNVYCSCGYSGIESHGNFYSNFPNPTVTCGLCGYNLMNIEEEHEII